MELPAFKKARDRHVVRLLALRPMTFSELHAAVGGDTRSFKRRLEALRDADELLYASFGETSPGRSHPAGLWALPSAVAAAVRRGETALLPESDQEAAAVVLNRNQEWLAVDVAAQRLPAFAAVVASGELVAPASAVIELGGALRFLFAFDRSLGPQPLDNLEMALARAGFDPMTGTVRDVADASGFLARMATALQAAEAAVDDAAGAPPPGEDGSG